MLLYEIYLLHLVHRQYYVFIMNSYILLLVIVDNTSERKSVHQVVVLKWL